VTSVSCCNAEPSPMDIEVLPSPLEELTAEYLEEASSSIFTSPRSRTVSPKSCDNNSPSHEKRMELRVDTGCEKENCQAARSPVEIESPEGENETRPPKSTRNTALRRGGSFSYEHYNAVLTRSQNEEATVLSPKSPSKFMSLRRKGSFKFDIYESQFSEM